MKTLFMFCMLLVITGSVWATTDWWDGTGPAPGQSSRDRDWFNAANWVDSGNVIIPGVPTATTEVRTHRSNSAPYNLTAIIADTSPYYTIGGAVASVINIGGVAATNNGGVPHGQLTIESGKLTVGNGLRVGGSSSSVRSGELYVNGGTIDCSATYLAVGYGPSAGGTSGWMYMTNGTINANQFDIGRVAGTTNGVNGYAYISGGTINANDFRMKPAGGAGTVLLDISGSGKIVITGDKVATVRGYIDNGWIKTNGAEVDYSVVSLVGGNTVITVPEPATMMLLGLGVLGLIRRK